DGIRDFHVTGVQTCALPILIVERGLLSRAQLPLVWRLPNGASMFVGREGELSRLAHVLSRAPVAVVWGGAGVGKTALVLESLARGRKSVEWGKSEVAAGCSV